MQLESIEPAEVAWFPVGSCVRRAGALAGRIVILDAPRLRAVAILAELDALAWLRIIEPGESCERIAGGCIGAKPRADFLENMGFRPAKFEALAAILAARPAGFAPVRARFDVYHAGRLHHRSITNAQFERGMAAIPEEQRHRFELVPEGSGCPKNRQLRSPGSE